MEAVEREEEAARALTLDLVGVLFSLLGSDEVLVSLDFLDLEMER